MNIQDITNEWSDKILEYFEGFTDSGLNQVYARGCFAGMSCRQVQNLAKLFRENRDQFPPWDDDNKNVQT